MRIECTNCGRTGNIKTGANMGWFKVVVKEDGSIIIKCKDCGEEVELEYQHIKCKGNIYPYTNRRGRNMHISIINGDFIFAEWEADGWKKFDKKVHELRLLGFRKINQEHDYLNYYEYYRKKGNKKIVTVTLMCC